MTDAPGRFDAGDANAHDTACGSRSARPLATSSRESGDRAMTHRVAPDRDRVERRAARLRPAGLWRGRTIGDSWLATCEARGDAIALFDGEEAISFRELRERTLRFAAALLELGVEPGDGVASQLPNWWEAAAVFLATALVGAHAIPIVPILREREVSHVLRTSRPRVAFVPASLRGVDHVALLRSAALDAGGRAPVAVAVRPSPGATAGDALDARDLLARPPAASLPPVAPESLAAIVWTSGSTAAPKGALHLHETLVAELASLVDAHALGPDDRVLMPSPLGHVSGIVHGILAPALLGTSAVLLERWEPGAGLREIERRRATYMVGAPTFLSEMLLHPEVGRRDLSSLRLFSCGGASVPPELLQRAGEVLPAMVAKRVYGSSEFPTIATTTAADAASRGRDTEGRALRGVEIRVCDEAGRALPPGSEGEIRARGPECFLGWVDATLDPETFDDDDFLRTGDLGVLDGDGYLRVTGRLKDIVVRKGEKISAREIEDLLAGWPGVLEVAVVPVSDPETGERACACLLLREGAPRPTLGELVDFLRGARLATRKLPERLRIVETFPRTPSGKVNKRLLREQVEASPAGA